MTNTTSDQVHAQVWANQKTVASYKDRNTFLDAGEEAGYAMLAPQLKGAPILDLGIGAGRTIPMLTSLSSDYVGIDYSTEMVELARKQYPGFDLRTGDARDLSAFPDNHFQLVMFSHNGIDCVDHEGRQQVLKEAMRVLKPGGHFFYATLNQDGVGRRFRPWQIESSFADFFKPGKVVRAIKDVLIVPRRLRNYIKGRKLWREEHGWSMAPIATHDFTLIMHYISLDATLDEVRRHGFEPAPVVLDSGEGLPVPPGSKTDHIFWFQVIARKPLA
ncbi:MAG: class I SAM-dependent methyltransferase [Rhizobacter sp.]